MVQQQKFFGKYRGVVTNNKDPLVLGRIEVSVPGILGSGRNSWALPCTPFAGKDVGFFAIPPIGANVWVEFEAGDPDFPIWSGCFWGTDQMPAAVRREDPTAIVLLQTVGISLELDSTGEDRGFLVTVGTPVSTVPLKLLLNKDGISLSHGTTTKAVLKADSIDLSLNDTKVTLQTNDILLQTDSTKVEVNVKEIRLVSNPAIATFSTTKGIQLAYAPASTTISANGVELTAGSPSLKITPATIDLTNAAASLKLTPATVNINNGALEVL
jgi:hypothetical protein